MCMYEFIVYSSFCFQIQAKGMEVVTQLTMAQFFMLFANLLIWKAEVHSLVSELK